MDKSKLKDNITLLILLGFIVFGLVVGVKQIAQADDTGETKTIVSEKRPTGYVISSGGGDMTIEEMGEEEYEIYEKLKELN